MNTLQDLGNMAEKTLLEKAGDEPTTCSICLDSYTDPKLLQCFHVFCQGCLSKLAVKDEQEQLVLTCPRCHQVTPVPGGGVAGLQSAFHINQLLQDHKKEEDEPAHAENSPPDKVSPCCSKHTDEELKLYCKSCGKLICWKCANSNHKHHDHESLDKALEQYKEEIESLLVPMEKQMKTISHALEQLDTNSGKITKKQTVIEADIHTAVQRLQEILGIREAQLIDQLNQITQGQLKSLAAQRDQLETTQDQLGSCHDFMKKSMESESHGDMLNMKTNVVKQAKKLTTPLQPDLLNPSAEPDISYLGSSNIFTDCQKFGRFSGPSFCDPSKCYITGYDASMKGQSKVFFNAVNFKGNQCNLPINLECELVSEIFGTRVLCRAEKIEQGKYEISYQPTIKGRHHLHIKVEGQHIRGSPFSMAVKLPIEKLGDFVLHTIKIQKRGDPYTIMGDFRPSSVAISPMNELVVCDHATIRVISPSGKELLSFGSCGTADGQFNLPSGLAVDKHGNIYVADGANDCVQKFSPQGQFLASSVVKIKKRLLCGQPQGIAYSTSNNKVYVTDGFNRRIVIFNSDLSFASAFQDDLYHPSGIACVNAKVYVSDDHSIKVFTEEGKLLNDFGRFGYGEGELNGPSTLAVDTNGLVYVCETSNHRVSIFNSEGQFVKTFGSEGSKPGQFMQPHGIAVDSCGVVYVCEMDNSRIQMF